MLGRLVGSDVSAAANTGKRSGHPASISSSNKSSTPTPESAGQSRSRSLLRAKSALAEPSRGTWMGSDGETSNENFHDHEYDEGVESMGARKRSKHVHGSGDSDAGFSPSASDIHDRTSEADIPPPWAQKLVNQMHELMALPDQIRKIQQMNQRLEMEVTKLSKAAEMSERQGSRGTAMTAPTLLSSERVAAVCRRIGQLAAVTLNNPLRPLEKSEVLQFLEKHENFTEIQAVEFFNQHMAAMRKKYVQKRINIVRAARAKLRDDGCVVRPTNTALLPLLDRILIAYINDVQGSPTQADVDTLRSLKEEDLLAALLHSSGAYPDYASRVRSVITHVWEVIFKSNDSKPINSTQAAWILVMLIDTLQHEQSKITVDMDRKREALFAACQKISASWGFSRELISVEADTGGIDETAEDHAED